MRHGTARQAQYFWVQPSAGVLHCSERPEPLTLLGGVHIAAGRFAFVTPAELVEVSTCRALRIPTGV